VITTVLLAFGTWERQLPILKVRAVPELDVNRR
jgi:hypothetical protein